MMIERRSPTTWLPMEVHAVDRYEWLHGTSVSIIYGYQQTVYCETVMNCQIVGHWCCTFEEGRQKVEDECRNGHLSESSNEETIYLQMK
ncbi:hypothetical protein TNCV_2296261 [Trichonephila clavipes]|nr:hypothetical protein TNCV_2296261 [Trichonephila clavipes]